jgi:hypothetical protein
VAVGRTRVAVGGMRVAVAVGRRVEVAVAVGGGVPPCGDRRVAVGVGVKVGGGVALGLAVSVVVAVAVAACGLGSVVAAPVGVAGVEGALATSRSWLAMTTDVSTLTITATTMPAPESAL